MKMPTEYDMIVEKLTELSEGKAMIFAEPNYDTALIGIGEIAEPGIPKKCLAVYDYQLMIQWVMNDFKICRDDAIEFIDFNTLGTSVVNNPIILYRS